MPDKRTISIARNWVGWVGEKLAAEAMGVSEEVIREWVGTDSSSKDANIDKSHRYTQEEKTKDAEEKTRRHYTQEEKAEALRLAEELGPSKAARQTGIPLATLNLWRQKCRV